MRFDPSFCHTVVAVFFLSALKEYTSVELICKMFSMCAIFVQGSLGRVHTDLFPSIIAVHIYVTDACFKSFYFDKFLTLNMFSRVYVSWIE